MIIIINTWFENHQAVLQIGICVQTDIFITRIEYCCLIQLFSQIFLSGYEVLAFVWRKWGIEN